MEFSLGQSIEILERTPIVIENMLSNLSVEWIVNNEGEESWSPFDILGHLVHGDKYAWPDRIKKAMDNSIDRHFEPYDRYAQLTENQGKSLQDLIDEFNLYREQNLQLLETLEITAGDLTKTATHPALGLVTLQQILATWVVHDLNHISQMARVLAHQYNDHVGPWHKNLTILSGK